MKRFFSLKFLFVLCGVVLTSFAAKAEEKALPQLNITYDVNALNYNSYIPGTMSLSDTDGSKWESATKFKTRGATALQYPAKPSLNMKLEDAEGNENDLNLLGLRKASSFILDAMAIDRINMRNRVAFDIWNSFSKLPYDTEFGSRNGTVGRFVEVYVNGKYKGIYCLSDKINRKLLDLKKPEVDESTGKVTVRGLLYKNGTSDIEDQNTSGYFNGFTVFVPEWHDAWELHEPEEYPSKEVWGPLAALYTNSNYENYAYVKEHFWIENLADIALHTMALCIADYWGNKNRYFSIQNVTKSGDKSRFVVTPWDLDTSFGGEYDGSKFNGDYKDDWAVADAEKSAPKPLSICFAQPAFRQIMKERWIEGRAGAFAVDSVCGRLRETAALFIESGAWQRTLKAANPDDLIVSDLQKEVELICEWYATRFAEMDSYFGITDTDIAGVDFVLPELPEKSAIYNLQGIRMNEVVAPGMYIIDGHKVIIR